MAYMLPVTYQYQYAVIIADQGTRYLFLGFPTKLRKDKSLANIQPPVCLSTGNLGFGMMRLFMALGKSLIRALVARNRRTATSVERGCFLFHCPIYQAPVVLTMMPFPLCLLTRTSDTAALQFTCSSTGPR